MRFVWTDAGDDPSWGVGDAHGIDGYFAPLWDPLTPEVLEEAGERGHVQGAYFGHNWRPGASGVEIAREVSAEYKRLAIPGLRIMFNLEEHAPEHIASCLEEWRRLRPKVNTSWSCEGMQGGWMGPVLLPGQAPEPGSFIARVLACRVRIVPQSFWGDMRPIAADQVLRDLTRRGFPEHIVSLFYDASDLGDRWDGYAFTMGRLP